MMPLILAALLVAVPHPSNVLTALPVWQTEGIFAGPRAGTIMADSGPLAQGVYTVGLYCGTDLGGTFALEQVSADAGAVFKSQLVSAQPSTAWPGFPISLGLNQHVRIVAEQVQGTAQCSLFLDPRP